MYRLLTFYNIILVCLSQIYNPSFLICFINYIISAVSSQSQLFISQSGLFFYIKSCKAFNKPCKII
ncbi:hypothetical protein JCM9157_520 [Halalkalibacter akibai JCM 9157]|uniref:Uncharacterized protein n=1 Tax=Halalkalibacter akibai (strain ATCC 43226 / DSM 21942 / CIP 109018 / JCM 9157 / 1139) TaxID=1236973 RepID=W4QN68_HALA3|nr:hypothetical protein JCM9157_520 [Halalkalibacter akibai JCM 9157]